MSTPDEKKAIDNEIVEHIMNPKNYGELHDADGVGVGVDNATKAYTIFYVKLDNDTIADAMYATSGSQDAVALGSMLTEMVKGETIENAESTVSALEEELATLYPSKPPKIDISKPEGEQVEAVSTEQQDSANMALTAFRAALKHIERKAGGIEEEQYSMNIKKRCPYSNTDCEFM